MICNMFDTNYIPMRIHDFLSFDCQDCLVPYGLNNAHPDPLTLPSVFTLTTSQHPEAAYKHVAARPASGGYLKGSKAKSIGPLGVSAMHVCGYITHIMYTPLMAHLVLAIACIQD